MPRRPLLLAGVLVGALYPASESQRRPQGLGKTYDGKALYAGDNVYMTVCFKTTKRRFGKLCLGFVLTRPH